ncbi:hypothetical protein BDY21DRAFT_340279 [Lineolata rhizophorae]|uniref:Uncharacterized protein n=1 Tax=Lineolata rhizophorae TaxID=578093 RepID=A0A6A6P3T8_9PEZI|nr:hypothetical protein BDY21DRAFT_340279 [Lineolata rhizophorae]
MGCRMYGRARIVSGMSTELGMVAAAREERGRKGIRGADGSGCAAVGRLTAGLGSEPGWLIIL